jgi:hypothetical protein
MTTFEDEMHELENQLAEMERLAREIESTGDDPSDVLHALAEGAKHAQETIERAKRAAETEAATPAIDPDAPAT